MSICGPMLISSVCQLLYNLSVLLAEETLLNVNNNGIMRLLLNYVKANLVNRHADEMKLEYEHLVHMLRTICQYLMLCCDLEKNCVIMFAKDECFISDLIELIELDTDKRERIFFKIV